VTTPVLAEGAHVITGTNLDADGDESPLSSSLMVSTDPGTISSMLPRGVSSGSGTG
jgi:hypothetical protein